MNETLTPYHQSKEQIALEVEDIRAAQKDSAKFSVLYKKYFEQIFLFVLKRVETEDIAADITSQIFLKALTNLNKYKEMGLPFSSWLFRIARNEIYDMYAHNKIELVVSVESKGISKIISEIGEDEKEDYSKLNNALGMLDNAENNAKVKTYRVLDILKKLLNNGK